MQEFNTVDEYIDTFPDDIQQILEKIRKVIRDTAPEAKETISYKIPTYNLHGRYFIYFAGWKKHIGMYPINSAVKKQFKKELAKYKQSKGTVQFPYDKLIPYDLIKKTVRFKVGELSAGEHK